MLRYYKKMLDFYHEMRSNKSKSTISSPSRSPKVTLFHNFRNLQWAAQVTAQTQLETSTTAEEILRNSEGCSAVLVTQTNHTSRVVRRDQSKLIEKRVTRISNQEQIHAESFLRITRQNRFLLEFLFSGCLAICLFGIHFFNAYRVSFSILP